MLSGKTITSVIAAGIFLSTAPHVLIRAQSSLSDLFAQTKPSVMAIIAKNKSGETIMRGSGFCVAENRVITNKHVIEGAATIEIRTSDGLIFKVLKTPSVDKLGDLALLETERLPAKVKPLPIASIPPREGDRIVVVGNPLGLDGSISDGIVSAFRRIQDLGTLIQITAPISPGSSGSPVVNLNGEVVGVATLNLKGGQNLNFAIASHRIVEIWPEIGTAQTKPFEQLSPSPPKAVSTQSRGNYQEQIRQIGSFINAKEYRVDYDKFYNLLTIGVSIDIDSESFPTVIKPKKFTWDLFVNYDGDSVRSPVISPALCAQIYNSKPMFDESRRLIFLVDGTRLDLKDSGTYHRESLTGSLAHTFGEISESLCWEISSGQYNELLNSKELEFRVGYVDGRFSNNGIKMLKQYKNLIGF